MSSKTRMVLLLQPIVIETGSDDKGKIAARYFGGAFFCFSSHS